MNGCGADAGQGVDAPVAETAAEGAIVGGSALRECVTGYGGLRRHGVSVLGRAADVESCWNGRVSEVPPLGRNGC
ncbi:hypothetical protein SDC9_189508 [bioreactor metagenome]|uniref:Uncharacterized protein n=1 Tax=bioreactor metagenome TaxID=1076179 RepID=A0A645I394_9ZZZZ